MWEFTAVALFPVLGAATIPCEFTSRVNPSARPMQVNWRLDRSALGGKMGHYTRSHTALVGICVRTGEYINVQSASYRPFPPVGRRPRHTLRPSGKNPRHLGGPNSPRR